MPRYPASPSYIAPGQLQTGVTGNLGSDPATVEAPTPDQSTQREVVYSAGLRIVVVSTTGAMNSVNSLAREVGGHLQESDARSITIRVPAGQFDSCVEQISKLGEVVDRAIKASDVTEQMLDLDIRLDNARKTRERLLDHLKKSEKLEDTIKLEAEVMRVSTEIEQIEGKLRVMKSMIAMSTIKVEFNTNQPQPRGGPKQDTPFDWIGRLGDGLIAGNVEAMPREPRFFSGGPKFDPPAGFVRYYSNDNLVEAMNADGLRIKLQRHPNFDKGPIEFWQTLARKSLVENRSLAITSEGPIDDHDSTWTRVIGTREVAGQMYGYLLVTTRTNDHAYSYEAWGPTEMFDEQVDALTTSARSLRR